MVIGWTQLREAAVIFLTLHNPFGLPFNDIAVQFKSINGPQKANH
jgi:hypothetical protein